MIKKLILKRDLPIFTTYAVVGSFLIGILVGFSLG